MKLAVTSCLLAGCSLLIDPPHYEPCTDPAPRCDGDDLLVCEGGFPATLSCPFGCDQGACLSSCGDRIVQPPEVCDDGNTIDGDGCSGDCSRLPAEGLVNTTTEGEQDTPAVASDELGFVALFEDESMAPPGGSESRILARTLNQCGSPMFGDFAVSSTTAGKQVSPRIAAGMSATPAAPRTFFIVWGVGKMVRARLLVDDRFPQQDIEVAAAAEEDVEEMEVAAGPDGLFIVVWQEAFTNGNSFIRGRLYQGGEAITGVFPISSGPRDVTPAVVYSTDPSLRFVAIWSTGGGAIAGGFVTFDGTVEDAFTASTRSSMQTLPALARGNGRTLAVWSDGTRSSGTSVRNVVVGRPLDANGPISAEEVDISADPVDSTRPSAAWLPNEGFTVAWERDPLGGADLQRRRVGLDAQPMGEASMVNTILAGEQARPEIAVSAGGTLLIWEDTSGVAPDNNGDAVRYLFEVKKGGPCDP